MSTVHILGFDTRLYPPAMTIKGQKGYLFPKGEIWGMNPLHRVIPSLPWDRWFEIHPLDYLKTREAHWEWLRAQQPGRPIYMQQRVPEVPASKPFPLEDAQDFLRELGAPPRYLCSSFAYMLVLAMMEEHEDVWIWGCSFVTNDAEVQIERTNLEFLVGLALGRGVRVRFPEGCPLLQSAYLYGYQEPRMDVEGVRYVLDFLEQEIAFQEERIEHYEDESERDMAIDAKGAAKALREMRRWMRLYGKGGTLMRKDGSVN